MITFFNSKMRPFLEQREHFEGRIQAYLGKYNRVFINLENKHLIAIMEEKEELKMFREVILYDCIPLMLKHNPF